MLTWKDITSMCAASFPSMENYLVFHTSSASVFHINLTPRLKSSPLTWVAVLLALFPKLASSKSRFVEHIIFLWNDPRRTLRMRFWEREYFWKDPDFFHADDDNLSSSTIGRLLLLLASARRKNLSSSRRSTILQSLNDSLYVEMALIVFYACVRVGCLVNRCAFRLWEREHFTSKIWNFVIVACW